MPSLPTTTVKLDAVTEARVQRLAETRRQSADWVMQEAVAQYLEREEARETLRQATVAAWANFDLTGLHLNESEADAWLARLEAGEDVEPPECHA